MEEVELRRSKRLAMISFMLNTQFILNVYLAFLAYRSQDQLYFNLLMIITLIDRVLSIVVVVIKNQYLQLWILDGLNLSFLYKYTVFYFPEHQSILTYAIYFKALPSIIIQLVCFYLKNTVFYAIQGDMAVLFIAFQLNILNMFLLVKSLFLNSQEFSQSQNDPAGIPKKNMFIDSWINLFNAYCLYNMWAVVITQQQEAQLRYNICLWCIIIFIIFLILELKQTKHFKSSIYALSSFQLKLQDLKDLSFSEILIRKSHTLRLQFQLFVFLVISVIVFLIQRHENGNQYIKTDQLLQGYQDLIKTVVLLNFLFSIKNIFLICKEIKIDIHPENNNLSRVMDNIINDNKSSHFIVLTSISLIYDYFEVNSTVNFSDLENKDKIAEIDMFYFFSKIFEIINKKNGSVLIQSLLKTQNGSEVVIIDKNFKVNQQLQLSILCNSEFLPKQGLFDIEFNKENINKIVQERFTQGLLFENTIQQKISNTQKEIFDVQRQILRISQLQIYAFQKQLKTLVINNPSQVLYDLYEI